MSDAGGSRPHLPPKPPSLNSHRLYIVKRLFRSLAFKIEWILTPSPLSIFFWRKSIFAIKQIFTVEGETLGTNICQRRSYKFYTVSYYIKWVMASWTYSINGFECYNCVVPDLADDLAGLLQGLQHLRSLLPEIEKSFVNPQHVLLKYLAIHESSFLLVTNHQKQ